MQKMPPPTDLKPYFLVLEDIDQEYGGKLDWPVFFGNDHEVELDVGCGRGLFLFRASETRPGTNFLGMEIDYREGRRSARRLQKQERQNARVLGGDANVALDRMIEPHSVSAIHVYFPDPWWKKRHRRRRIFTDEFVGRCARLLKPGGYLHSWTDVEEYFGVISGIMDHHELFTKEEPPAEVLPEHDMDYQTSFERKKRKDGWEIFRGLWQRKAL
ncbi:MAG: tRNA (guanosine(46)-N7)-methyltransferase TrmB [Planctomycetaceae bacterium]|nr:tRNA (guanosine(46)-N7)-methyltransferase TrmB [Planctomycetaceae bacterium]MCB9953242.1 tRNA (guanosine(46)-N7)-methyltransferase TrmB [Planctomycetaceae bacterium]